MIAAIRRSIVERHHIAPAAVALVAAGSLPKTTSGKLQRYLCARAFAAGGAEILVSEQNKLYNDAQGFKGIRNWFWWDFTRRVCIGALTLPPIRTAPAAAGHGGAGGGGTLMIVPGENDRESCVAVVSAPGWKVKATLKLTGPSAGACARTSRR